MSDGQDEQIEFEYDVDYIRKRSEEMKSLIGDRLNHPENETEYREASNVVNDFFLHNYALREWGSTLISECLKSIRTSDVGNNVAIASLNDENGWTGEYCLVDNRSTFVDVKRVSVFSSPPTTLIPVNEPATFNIIPLKYQGLLVAHYAPLFVTLPLSKLIQTTMKREFIKRDTARRQKHINWNSFDAVRLFADYYDVSYTFLVSVLSRNQCYVNVSTLSYCNGSFVELTYTSERCETLLSIGFNGNTLDIKSIDDEPHSSFNPKLLELYSVSLFFTPKTWVPAPPPGYVIVGLPTQSFGFNFISGLQLTNIEDSVFEEKRKKIVGISSNESSSSLNVSSMLPGSFRSAYREQVILPPERPRYYDNDDDDTSNEDDDDDDDDDTSSDSNDDDNNV